MRYEIDEIGEVVEPKNLENKIVELVSKHINIPFEKIIIPPAGCIIEDDFTVCNFVADNSNGAVFLTIEKPDDKIKLKHGIIFFKCKG